MVVPDTGYGELRKDTLYFGTSKKITFLASRQTIELTKVYNFSKK